MSQAALETLLAKTGALLTGHFLLSSGRHAERYVQCARALEHPREAEALGKALAALAPRGAEAVVAPALGALLIGYETARALGVRYLFTERDGGRMVLRRGFALRPGEKVVVVEDVVTTGKSVRECAEAARAAGAEVLAVLALADRSGGTAEVGAPFKAAARLEVPSYEPSECPACRRGLPLVKPGSRPQP